ncbi:AraC family transcriptional regulator [Novosphingobium terrae]|uniref:AraC family transcriptional regulator n=1 Tax=Novosphingobium terrae TaxID=2726189 RepID=UPI001F133D4C|nr:helix-turn-helix transcriptional regulator [Novosphingobium terrae]
MFLRSVELAAGQAFEFHEHGWNQLVYGLSGSLIVYLMDRRYVITPQQAIWVPTGTVHASGSFGGASFRSLWIADAPDLAMPGHCAVLEVSPFLRALIAELDRTNGLGPDRSYIDHLDALILTQLRMATKSDFSLPWPGSPPLRRLCEALYNDPADARTAGQWGHELAIAPRTLARKFEAEVGMTLRNWRRKLRLFRALEWLGQGHSITRVAMDLGYASPSAFTYMFRTETGVSPLEWQKSHLAGRPAS